VGIALQVWMVPPARFQRATFRLGGGRSMQLSYGSTPRSKLAECVLTCPEKRFDVQSLAFRFVVLVAGLSFWLLVCGFSFLVSSFFICVNLRNLRMHLISLKTHLSADYADYADEEMKPKDRNPERLTLNFFCYNRHHENPRNRFGRSRARAHMETGAKPTHYRAVLHARKRRHRRNRHLLACRCK
jgi:hypothetical protein